MSDLSTYRKLSISLLKALRGKLSRRQLSVKLDKSPNVISRWEAGSRLFYFDQLIEVCLVRRIDIAGVINRSFIFNGELNEVSIFNFLRGKESARAYGKALGVPRARIQQIISGRSRVPCYLMLKAIDIKTKSLGQFLFSIGVPIEEIEKQLGADRSLRNSSVLSRSAWNIPALSLIETQSYRSLSLPQPQHIEWLAHALDIDSASCAVSLGELKKADFIVWKKNHWIKNFQHLHQAGIRSVEELQRDAHYWFSRLQKHFSKAGGSAQFSNGSVAFQTVAVSEFKARRLNELVRIFWNDTTTLLLEEDPSPNSHAYLLAVQLIDLVELAKG